MDEATFGDVTVELRMGTIVAQPDVGALMNATINGALQARYSLRGAQETTSLRERLLELLAFVKQN